MGLFSNLFGKQSGKLHDAELGEFVSLSKSKLGIVWKGQINFLGTEVDLFVSGNETELETEERQMILNIISNSEKIMAEADKALQEQYSNADKSYSEWSEHFRCVSISTTNNELEICFEEFESSYHFNVHFVEDKAVDVSIDS
jgi:hypothetical protein